MDTAPRMPPRFSVRPGARWRLAHHGPDAYRDDFELILRRESAREVKQGHAWGVEDCRQQTRRAKPMIVNDENQHPGATAKTAVEPTPPPVDPADRPRIEPTDALPTDDGPGLAERAKSLLGDEDTASPAPAPAAGGAAEPTPPPVDPADRPRIEPTDALPTEDQHQRD